MQELVEAFASIVDARIARLEAKLDATNLNGGTRWFSTKGAARHLDTTEVAIRSLVQRGKLEHTHNGVGNLMFKQEWLDLHAQAGSSGQ
jgi:hypothetical protein